MATMYRYVSPFDGEIKTETKHATLRLPSNVPYVTDNLWEWKRPGHMPSRRRVVFASPEPGLAKSSGTANEGVICVVEARNAIIAQLPVSDAKDHRDVTLRIHSLLVKELGPDWPGKSMAEKSPEAMLWCPGLTAQEVEQVFSASSTLSKVRDQIWESIRLWDDVRLVDEDAPWPFPQGEIFFEADAWTLRKLPV